SVWAFDVTKNNVLDTRFIALGRDSDASPAGAEDNEPTGLHFSNGESSIEGLVGANPVDPEGSRLFFTQQHGKNIVWEVLGQQNKWYENKLVTNPPVDNLPEGLVSLLEILTS